MKIVIEVPEENYERLKLAKDVIERNALNDPWIDAILAGTPLPDNPTNGDMIKAMFPSATIEILKSDVEKTMVCVTWNFKDIPSYYNRFYEDWWNAPYKKEVE